MTPWELPGGFWKLSNNGNTTVNLATHRHPLSWCHFPFRLGGRGRWADIGYLWSRSCIFSFGLTGGYEEGGRCLEGCLGLRDLARDGHHPFIQLTNLQLLSWAWTPLTEP